MGIPVKIRTYKNSIPASLVSLLGTLADAIFKLLALAGGFGIISELGFLRGLIPGVLIFVVCVALGALVQALFVRLADAIALRKLHRK